MANQALYTIQIPTTDNLGNQLSDLATAGHQWLWQQAGIQGSRIKRGVHGNWEGDPQEVFDDLEVVAEDTPEMDSYIKQLAKHLNEAANQWGMFVMKQGGGNVQSWVIDNPTYQEGQPAPSAQAEPSMENIVSSLFGRPVTTHSGHPAPSFDYRPDLD